MEVNIVRHSAFPVLCPTPTRLCHLATFAIAVTCWSLTSVTSSAADYVLKNDRMLYHDEWQPPLRVEPDKDELTLLGRVIHGVDNGFGSAVGWMEAVLFYRVLATERDFIEIDHQQHYSRKVESGGEYRPVSGDGASLDETAVARLKAGGKVETGTGTLAGKKVEFVIVLVESGKYVLGDDGRFRKLERREQLSDDKSLSKREVEELLLLGTVTAERQKKMAGKPIAYVQRESTGGAPIVVLWLALGAIFFTIYMRGFNIWGFSHAIAIVRGKYDNPNEPGEVTHFQALASALSATVGLGNIAGVTIAMATGGPGAFFWMMFCGVFGMTSKFVECTLGQRFRTVKPDGTVLGGPMQYLHIGLRDHSILGKSAGGAIGYVLSIVFAIMCILASFGGGNMFQSNQSQAQMNYLLRMGEMERLAEINVELKSAAEESDDDLIANLTTERETILVSQKKFNSWFPKAYGLVLAALVGVVIIGGIKRIGAAAEKVVPTMCAMYLMACIFIIGRHLPEIPGLIVTIFTEAFTPGAFGGGFLGVLVIGVQRAAFSNEAGVGSASIAHSAAKTDEPVREGTVALMGPFIDTVIVCSMTAMVILITGAWDNQQWIVEEGLVGTPLTTRAFQQEISWFPYVLSVAVVLFAYSTLISWSYYGERCWERLFGPNSTMVYKGLYVMAAFFGAIFHLGAVLDFSDMMILSMAFPNIFGLILLTPLVRRDLLDYWRRYKAGEFKSYK
jgi:AGCS family alanine or glycine:cation symporter